MSASSSTSTDRSWRVVWLAVRFFWCTQYVIRHFERDSIAGRGRCVHWHPTAPLSTRPLLAYFGDVVARRRTVRQLSRHGGRTFAAAELQDNLAAAKRAISEGQPISSSFARHGLAKKIGVRMLAAGERTGNMAEMMDHVARLYDEELGEWIERFTRLFEPLLMTAIGVTIGVLVLLMYLPIFGLASSIE